MQIREAILLGSLYAVSGVATGLSAQQAGSKAAPIFREDFNGQVKSGWQWVDPKGDCTRSLDARKGYLRIVIPEGARHDLWAGADNFYAPRLVREVEGDFTLETKLTGPTHPDGGLLVWKDYRNNVRFERGIHFRNNLSFGAAVDGKYFQIADDYVAGDPIWLRLERSGSTYRASYSRDGNQWQPMSRTYTGLARVVAQDREDWMDGLQEDDFHFKPVSGSVEMRAQGALLVGISALTKRAQRIIDYDYFEIRGR